MLNWASRFNICLFLDNHAYQIEPHTFECLLAVGALEELSIPAGGGGCSDSDAFRLLREFTGNNTRDWLFGHIGYEAAKSWSQDQHPPARPAYSSYPPGALIPPGLTTPTDPTIPTTPTDPIGFPDLFFFVPGVVIELQKNSMRIGLPVEEGRVVRGGPDLKEKTTTDEQTAILFRQILDTPAQAGVPAVTTRGPLQSGFTREEYIETVERLRAHILRGDCYEINFCQEFFADQTELDPVAIYLALSEASPTPFGAFYRLDDRYLLCASPERYLASHAGRLLSQPIKGTSPRDLQDPVQDETNKQSLYHSEKDRSENVMVVDLVRNDLSRVCLPGSVRVDELYGIYSFPQVHQMISTISGELAPGIGFSDCIRETFPMGSMTGAPKKRVMELIAQYERSRRGLFSGSVGYVLPGEGPEPDSDLKKNTREFDFNVVIRSIFYNRTARRLSYQVGSAITFNSDPVQEYDECMLKAAGIRKALGI